MMVMMMMMMMGRRLLGRWSLEMGWDGMVTMGVERVFEAEGSSCSSFLQFVHSWLLSVLWFTLLW